MKTKRLLSVLVFAALLPLTALADVWQDPETKVNYEYTVGQSTASVKAGSWATNAGSPDATGNIAILPKITVDGNEYNVTIIGKYAFYECRNLTSVTIPEGVTSIGSTAFEYCTGLTDITFPSSVASIGSSAFSYCTGLTTLNLPTGLTTIEGNAFSNCSNLTSVIFHEGLTEIKVQAFQDCSGLTTLTLPSSLTTIGEYAFSKCTSLTSITIPSGVTSMEYNSFSYCTGLTSIVFAEGVKKISGFRGCSNLASAIIPSTATSIEPFAFDGCKALTSITIPSGVTSIGQNAFGGCTGLADITLPESLSAIGSSAFSQCTSLTNISIPSGVTTIDSSPFSGCTNLATITIEPGDELLELKYKNSFETNSDYTITIGRNIKLPYVGSSYTNVCFFPGATSVEVGGKMTAINDHLFCNATKLTSITMGNSVTGIGEEVFSGCSSLTSVKMHHLTPFTFVENAFPTDIYNNATLLVPAGTKDDYAATNYWKNFTHVDHWSTLVTLTSTAHGTLSTALATVTNGSEEYRQPKEDDIVYTLTADRGYELTSLTDNGADVSPLPALDEEQTRVNADGEEFVTLVAAFTPIIYTLSYDLAGGTLSTANPATYTIESETFTLVNPTRTGYEFVGWTGTDLTEPTQTVTIAVGSIGNREYTAVWKPIVYDIAYTLAGGTVEPENPATYTIESETFTLVNPTRTGYEFVGWTGTDLTEPTKTVTIAAGAIGNREYTAVWQIIEYAISYDLDGGTVATMNPTTYTVEDETFMLANPTKEGHDFLGWTGTELDAASETVTIAKGSTGDRAYTATWAKKVYTVTITGAGVTADKMNPVYEDDVVITIAEDDDRKLTSFTVNGVDVIDQVVGNQYTITNVSENIIVVATFEATKEFITMAHSQATFSCSQALDFTNVSGLKAYIASGYDNGMVLLTRVDKVPANTGLLLVGSEGATYKVPYAEVSSYYVNLLKPVLTAQVVPTTTGEYTNYLYGEKDGVKGFYKSSGVGEVSAQKAYLQLPTGAVGARVGMQFDDEDITGIGKVSAVMEHNAVYDLRGNKVASEFNAKRLSKGIYIVNGKKVVVK